jgi:hypothetical protein
MQTQDLVYFDGALQVHLSMNLMQNICYIYVYDVYNEKLTMRYFTDIEAALSWIQSI